MRIPIRSRFHRVLRTLAWLVALLALELAVWGLVQGFIRAVISGDFEWFKHPAVLWVSVPSGAWLLWVTAVAAAILAYLTRPGPLAAPASLRLPRLILWTVATAIAALTLVGLLTNRTGLGDLINGDVEWVDAPAHLLWFVLPDSKLLWLGVMLAVYVFLVYLGVVYQVHVQEAEITRDVTQPSLDIGRLADRVAGISISPDQRKFYIEMLLDPALRIERIMESIDPYERSVIVRTRYTIDLDEVPDPVFLPIELAARGRTEDGFQIEHPGDRPATNVSYLQSAAIAAAVIQDLVGSSGRSSLKQYQARTQSDGKSMEEGVLRQLARFPPRDNRLPDLRALARLSRSIMGIEGRLRHPENLYVVVRLLHRFHQSHPVTIVVASDVDSEGGSGRSTLVEVRRRVVPISTSLRPQDYWRLVVLESGSALAVFRVGLNKLTSLVRHFFGVRSSALSFPLTNAGRARSYHLEFKGPADTYMARQGFEDLRGSPLGILGVPQESALSPARGQRHSHLYIRDGDPWLSRRVRYRVSYFERTPGSMAIAFAAAASALLISIVISWNQALLVKETDASGLLQLLFAFPVATAAAGVVLQSRARWGGVLSARIANMVTFAATLGALWVSSLPSTFDALPKVWFAIIGVLAFVAAACLGSWIVRLFVHAKFLDAGEGE